MYDTWIICKCKYPYQFRAVDHHYWPQGDRGKERLAHRVSVVGIKPPNLKPVLLPKERLYRNSLFFTLTFSESFWTTKRSFKEHTNFLFMPFQEEDEHLKNKTLCSYLNTYLKPKSLCCSLGINAELNLGFCCFFFFLPRRICFNSKDRTTAPKLQNILTCQATLKRQRKRQTGFDLL